MYSYSMEQFEIMGDLMEDYKNWELFENDMQNGNPWA